MDLSYDGEVNVATDMIRSHPLHIFLCGAHSVGKTTLMHALMPHLTSAMHYGEEVARKVMTARGLTGENPHPTLDPAGFEELQQTIMFEQWKAENKIQNLDFVFDRGIDNLAYSYTYLNDAEATRRLMTKPFSQECIDRHGRSLVFLIRPSEDCIEHDGLRLAPSLDDLNRLHRNMADLFTVLKVGFIEIDIVDLPRRVDIVLKEIRRLRPDLVCAS